MAKKLDQLKLPEFQEALDYLCDPLVLEGLRKIKEFGESDSNRNIPRPNPTSGFDGSLAHLQVQPNLNKQFDPSTLNLNAPNSTPSSIPPQYPSAMSQASNIKEENSSNIAPASLSADAFNNFGSPKGIGSPLAKTPKRSLTGRGRGNTPSKKQKTDTEIYASLAELKRECIREVNMLLKTSKPNNDPDSVIWNAVNRLNRGIVVGPNSPHSFFKNIANCYPELKNLTDEEKVTNLLKRASRFVVENLSWMEVNTNYKILLPLYCIVFSLFPFL